MPRFCLLDDVAAIEVRGPDAEKFLNAQLARDVPPALPAGDVGAAAPLAAWNDARGRVRALFRALPRDDGWLLVTDRAMLAPVLATLPKYVLRARVTLREAENVRFAAVVDVDAAWRAETGLEELAPNRIVHRAGLAFIGLSSELVQVAGTADALAALGASLEPAPPSAAALAAIRIGLPAITPAVSERFVAQMLNLDVLDAVSFSKGCYPGQEVIARIRYRGEVKRRLKRFAAPGTELPAPGTELLDGAAAHVGDVVAAAPAESGIELLAVVDLAAHDVRLLDGRALLEQPLPTSALSIRAALGGTEAE
jgi:folate-binding protein YgfZ